MNSTNFFFVRYAWKGEVINKKLSFEKDSLSISAQDVFKVDGSSISHREVKGAKLFYKQGTTVSEIGTFAVAFPDERILKNVVTTFKHHSSLSGPQFLGELNSLLLDIYGRTDQDNIQGWVKKNMGTY